MVIKRGVKTSEDLANLTAEEVSVHVFADLIDKVIAAYKADPRNEVFVDEQTLLSCAVEETGSDLSVSDLRKVIDNFLSGEMSDEDQAIYDGAVYACSVAANGCFGDDPDDEVDYEINWIENDDGSFTAEVSPS